MKKRESLTSRMCCNTLEVAFPFVAMKVGIAQLTQSSLRQFFVEIVQFGNIVLVFVL